MLQDAFVQLFRYLPKYQASKGDIKSWAAKITIHVALKYNSKADPLNLLAISEEMLDYYAAPPKELKKLSDENLIDLLKKMPRSYYTVFNLAVIEEYSHQEIAEMLQITEVNSRKKLSRAKAWLRKHFVVSSLVPFIPNAL